MYGKIIYYLDRVSAFRWVCTALIFIFTAIHSRREHKENKISASQAFFRSVSAPYLLLILIFTVFIRLPNGFYGYELIPFWSYAEIIKNADTDLIFENLFNVIIFIPFGIITPLCGFKIRDKACGFKETAFVGLGFSFVIEIIQLVTRFGYFELDDIFHNTLGVVLGELIFVTVQRLIKKRGKRK